MRKFLVALACAALAAFAMAQSTPGLHYGQVPSAAQWNSYFGAKMDYVPGGTSTTYLRGDGTWATPAGSGSGTVTSAACSPSNGLSCLVSNPTTTPTFAIGLGAITPTSVSTGTVTASTLNNVTVTAPATGATLTISDGKALAATNSLTLSGTDGTTMTFPPASASVGYLGIPQNSQTGDYTLVLSDQGKHIYHPTTATAAQTWTIPANASVAFPIGTAVTFDNDAGAGAITIAITSDTLVLVGTAGTTGSRTLASGCQATAVKVTSTRWRISGGSCLS